jgi:hypothetical protein
LKNSTNKVRRGAAAVDEFEIVRASIRGQANTYVGLRQFRLNQNPARIYRLAGQFATHPAYRSIVLPSPFPKRISDISKRTLSVMGDFLRELAWAASLLKAFAQQLQSFVDLRNDVEKVVLAGDLDELEVLLNRGEATLGQSAWLVENRLNQFELVGAATNRTRYLQAIRQADPSSVFSYLVSWIAYRTGAAVSAGELERLMDEFGKRPHFLYDLVFALNGRYQEIGTEKAAEMLNFSDLFPLIDRYQIFLIVLQCLFASGTADKDAEAYLAAILADLCKHINDVQLTRLARAFGADVDVPLDREVLALLDELNNSTPRSEPRLQSDPAVLPTSIEALEIELRLDLAQGSGTEAGRDEATRSQSPMGIRDDLAAALRFSDDGVDARQRLQKIILTYCNTSWAASLRLILERQSHDERVLEPTRLQTVLGLRSTIEHPGLALTLPVGDTRRRVLWRYGKSFPNSPTVGALVRLCDIAQVNPPNGTDLDAAVFLLRRSRVNEALPRLEELVSGRYPDSVQLEASKLLTTAYWLDQRVPEMADLAATLYVRSRYFGSILPIRELVSKLLEWHDQPMSTSPTRGRLSVAIVLDIFSRYVSSEHLAEPADAFKDVLRANGVRKASELDEVVDKFPVDELVYFLRFVCVPDVLDQSLALETSRAVEDERVAILLLINELTEGVAPAAIKDELREIRTKQVVRETTLRLDQSKIYVNVEGIRRSIDVSMRDDWNRYRMMNNGIEQTLFDLLEQVRSDKSDKTDPLTIIIANPSERFTLLKKMIQVLRDEFTMNKEFGLNSNLSTNIRHGYVEREIRGPLLARKLITNKDTDSGSYIRNNFWIDRIDDEESGQALSDMFGRFSSGIDDQIDRLNRKLLRVRSDTMPEGMFNYTLSDTAIMAVDNTWSSKETFDEFLDSVFGVFWESTQRNLVQVRGALTTSVLSGLIECMNNFAQEVSANGFDTSLPDLEHAITLAQTEMRDAIDRVANWFTLSSNNEYQDFDLAIAFQAGMNTVKTYFRNLTIVDDYRSDGEMVVNGWCLPIFVRLFFLILDNAATHGARNRTSLRISMVVEVGGGNLLIRATNDLPSDHDKDELSRRVDEINRDYGQARAMELLAEEGGSGYPKIWKLLKTDLRKDHALHVKVTEDEFCVEILLPTGGILNEASNS